MSKSPEVPFDLVRIDIAGRPMLTVYGELDAVSSPRLHEAITDVISEGPDVVLIDMANVTFLDSSGLGALIVAHRRLEEIGGELRLVAVPAGPAKVLEITGLADRFHVYPDARSASSSRTKNDG